MAVDASLFRSLAALHRAGLPWSQALASAAGRDAGLQTARQRIEGGAALADALAPCVGPLDRALLAAGEASGTLEATLERMAVRHEEEDRLRATRSAALIYPVVLGHVVAVLAAIPDLVAHKGTAWHAPLWFLGILLPLYAVLWTLRPRRLRGAHPGTRPPRAGGLRRSAVEEADARSLLALAEGLDAGLRLDDTLRLAVQTGLGGRVAFDLHRARPRLVADGLPLHTAWRALPEPLAGPLRSAEQAGELSEAARRLAARLGLAVEVRRRKVAALLPLGLLLLVGAAVAARLFSFYADLYGHLGRF